MILVDTSVWVDHLRNGNPELERLLDVGRVLCHPVIIGELALGNLANRQQLIRLLARLPAAVQASHLELMTLIERRRLWGRGIGYSDAQLLAAAQLTQDAKIWTRDRRLQAAAEALGVAVPAND